MKQIWLALLLLVVLGLGLATGAVSAPRSDLPLASMSGGTFAKLADAVKPAVINVNTESRSLGAGQTPFEEYFGEEFHRRFFGDAPQRMPGRSLGSGVIIDPSGIALTNAHVVEKATRIEVVTLDGSKYKAKLVGIDRKTDLAVLKLDDGTGTFPFLPLGNSDEVQVGDWVIAVGSPFGLQATVTSGIISAKARQIGAGPFDDFLQTDAAINPGNSGGPLVNMRGEVIGINTAIIRGGSGIGFAVPSNMVKRISAELLAKGTVSRGWLGVSLQPLTPDLAKSFGAREKGALIADVVADSPAARAGLNRGDIVLEFDGKTIESPGDLARAVGMANPSQEATLKVWRERGEKSIRLKLGEAPGERQTAGLGIQVQPVTLETARELELRSAEGVVVTGVDEASAAARSGLRRGDVIREIEGQPVKTVTDFERLTKDVKEPLTLRIQRGGRSLYIAVVSTRE